MDSVKRPGALPGKGAEGAAATCQREAAALAKMLAGGRSNSAVTPDRSAASAKRRLAVRSSRWVAPISRISAASPVQAKLSAAAFRQAKSSGAYTRII